MKNSCFLIVLLAMFQCNAQAQNVTGAHPDDRVICGADRLNIYVPLLKGKNVGVFANQTSMVGSIHLVDVLLQQGVKIKKIFAPEHGFRGRADAGEGVSSTIDSLTGVPIVSLYGEKVKPTSADFKGIDILIFDVQDVGVRFYTYISSLQKFMEAAFENHKPLLILDRPNPNGFYVDGPVLDLKFRSFVGMQPIPIVYGMTIAEYALMIAGERWLSDEANSVYDFYKTAHNSPDTPFHFLVIKCQHYDHKTKYRLPVNPSPNLQNMQAIYLYPSLCLFEGTMVSLGRGTDKPFEEFGHPSFPGDLYFFTPRSTPGSKNPPLLNQICYGYDLSNLNTDQEVDGHVQLKWLIAAYQLFPDKEKFFLPSTFNRLAGTDQLIQQIKEGMPESAIRKSWEPALTNFKSIRKKYLQYEDF